MFFMMLSYINIPIIHIYIILIHIFISCRLVFLDVAILLCLCPCCLVKRYFICNMEFINQDKVLSSIIWQVNQKMLLTLAASIMYWSLQRATEDGDSVPSPADTTTPTPPDASPAPSTSGEDESSSLGGEFSNFVIDDAMSDTTVSSQLEYEVGEENSSTP